MKQDLVYFYFRSHDSLNVTCRGYSSSRAALKMSKLTRVYFRNIFLLDYTGRQNNN